MSLSFVSSSVFAHRQSQGKVRGGGGGGREKGKKDKSREGEARVQATSELELVQQSIEMLINPDYRKCYRPSLGDLARDAATASAKKIARREV